MTTSIATTIFSQLGGNRFAFMTGAKGFVNRGNGLSFRIGRNKSKTNMVKITLNGSDLYDIEFLSVPREPNYLKVLESCIKSGKDFDEEMKRKSEPKVVATYNDVFCDMLQSIFTKVTGMYTSL